MFVLIREFPFPMGVVYCPHPGGCLCGSTWRFADHPSTAAEVEETRVLVREALLEDGLSIPHWLQ